MFPRDDRRQWEPEGEWSVCDVMVGDDQVIKGLDSDLDEPGANSGQGRKQSRLAKFEAFERMMAEKHPRNMDDEHWLSKANTVYGTVLSSIGLR